MSCQSRVSCVSQKKLIKCILAEEKREKQRTVSEKEAVLLLVERGA